MAVNAINRLLSLMLQLQNLRGQVNEYVTQYNDANWSAVWNGLPTAPVNADGSPGAADATAKGTNPVDTRVVSGLNTCMSANDLINGVATIESLQAFFTGGAVATANRNAVIDLFQQG